MLTTETYNGHSDMPEEVRKLYHDSFPEDERIPWFRLMNMLAERKLFHVYREDSRLVGISCIFPDTSISYLAYLAVVPERRNHGYGSEIMKELLRAYDGVPMVIDIEEPDEQAENNGERLRRRDFYIRCGFQPAGIFYHFYDVDYELLSYGGMITQQQFHSLIRKYWGKIAETAVYRTEEKLK
jgi:GNAT superfamily N-acetyltransferase